MSLDGLRDAYLREKKNEIATCELSRKRKLRELYNYTALLNAGHPPSLRDWAISDEPNENERRFLDENDIAKGRHFDDTTLPYPFQNAPAAPSLPFQVSAKAALSPFSKTSSSPVVPHGLSLEEQLRAASASPSVANQVLPSSEVSISSVDAKPTKASSNLSHSVPSPSEEQPDEPVEEEVANSAPSEAQQLAPTEPPSALAVQPDENQARSVPDGPSVNPADAVPPSAEDIAALPDSEPEPPKAPQVVHLPSQEAQEARLQETEKKLEKAAEKDRKEDERLALPNASAQADAASSPSSTVGPYSQATPHAPHHSPDTSPDTESFHDAVSGPARNDVGPDPAAEQAKAEHEQALQRQMREARERARDRSPDTPEIERQIEDEQAMRLARDGKSRLSESEPAAASHSLTEHTEDVVHNADPELHDGVETKVSQIPAADSLPTPATTAPELATLEERADSLTTKAQPPTAPIADHPTPPADVDVEMDDEPAPVSEKRKGPLQSERSERMTTRVASGALRQKSVSEIIGEKAVPKPVLTPRSSNISASVTSRPRSREQGLGEVSTVIFAKKDTNRPSKALQLYSEEYASLQGASEDSSRDYLLGLFQYQAHHPPRSLPLQELLASARKTVSTAGTLAMIREEKDYKILKRVYQLQNANRWSLRQLQKSAEPPRPASHLDHLLAEMKWMSTDFKEERKWKRSLAATFADWCAEYVNSSPETRASLQIRRREPRPVNITDDDMKDAPTPELVHSATNETESDSFADEEELPLVVNPPASLFSMGFNDVIMKIEHNPVTDAMFDELPAYEPSLDDVTRLSFCDPAILPVSKFVTGKMVSKVRGPPRKRSRYEYDSEDEPSSPPSRSGTSAEHSMPSTPGRRFLLRNDLPPEMTDVALFNQENKHVRDRLQAAHQFRPPSEFPMPTVAFFETRNSSQWLWDEDQKLRSLVKEYTFNWSLVAQELTLPSRFVSGSGRRTPWECFERWVQLEGLPAEMSKTQYFRTYQSRLEQAQRTVTAQHQAQQQLMQQQSQGQNIAGQPRRRTTQPIRVERRRENRHLAIIDGMRKLARKRESAAHKQAEAQKAAALRKAHEPAPPKSNVHTPQEFSRLKWEREEKIRQRQVEHDRQMRQAMAAAAAQQRQASMSGQQGISNGVNQPQRNGTPSNPNANVATQMANPVSQQGHLPANGSMGARPMQGQQNMQGNFPNGNMSGTAMPGIPHAQMHAAMQNAQRMNQDQVRLAMQSGAQFPANNKLQFQLQQQQQQQINMAAQNIANMGMGTGMTNANMMSQIPGQMNGNMGMPMNGMGVKAGSPRAGQVNQSQSPARPLSSGHMPQLLVFQNQLKQQHPDWSPEQLQQQAAEQLRIVLARRSAMNAASGTPNMNGPAQIGNNAYLQNGGMPNSPSPNAVQNYQQQLVQQQLLMSQQRQQQAGSPGMNNARPVSRSATPQNPQFHQSPGRQQAQLSRN